MRRLYFYAFVVFWPLIVLFFNEYAIYYLVYLTCGWPNAPAQTQHRQGQTLTRALIIADTHLLGIYRGHWFDKLRREWQMRRSFQTAISMFRPNVVFFLGDLFDEGLLGYDHVFNSYVERFNELFATDENIKRYVVMGNHDIGFHHEIFPQRLNRFTRHFEVPNAVELLEFGGNIFVLFNSMALEGDNCHLCAEARREIDRIATVLNCTMVGDTAQQKCAKVQRLSVAYTRPIVMQHFPLYRRSDKSCHDTADVAPANIRSQKFKSKFDCLSNESTRLILDQLRPRAVFDGHTHYGCQKWWKAPDSFWEHTVPSFSWRNNHRPSFLLVGISPESIQVAKCAVPDEYFVIGLYVFALCIWLGVVLRWQFAYRRFHLPKFSKFRRKLPDSKKLSVE